MLLEVTRSLISLKTEVLDKLDEMERRLQSQYGGIVLTVAEQKVRQELLTERVTKLETEATASAARVKSQSFDAWKTALMVVTSGLISLAVGLLVRVLFD